MTEPSLDLRLQLRATVEDAMQLDGLDDKWHVDRGALLAKLDDLDGAQIGRVLAGARRFWDAVGRGEGATPTAELIGRAFDEQEGEPAKSAPYTERLEDIDYWWSGGFPGAFAADFAKNRVEPKLYAAFREVLLAMPADDFERFMELRPTIVCQPAINGAAYSYHLPVFPPGAETVILRVLYFRPDLDNLSHERVTRLVAHETAHLLLGHAEVSGQTVGAGDIHAEEATDRKAESWGFRGAYSLAHRRRLAESHRRAKQDRTS